MKTTDVCLWKSRNLGVTGYMPLAKRFIGTSLPKQTAANICLALVGQTLVFEHLYFNGPLCKSWADVFQMPRHRQASTLAANCFIDHTPSLMSRQRRLLPFILLNEMIVWFLDTRITSHDLRFYSGKDNGYFVRIGSIVVLSSILWALMSDQNRTRNFLWGLLIGILSSILKRSRLYF